MMRHITVVVSLLIFSLLSYSQSMKDEIIEIYDIETFIETDFVLSAVRVDDATGERENYYIVHLLDSNQHVFVFKPIDSDITQIFVELSDSIMKTTDIALLKETYYTRNSTIIVLYMTPMSSSDLSTVNVEVRSKSDISIYVHVLDDLYHVFEDIKVIKKCK